MSGYLVYVGGGLACLLAATAGLAFSRLMARAERARLKGVYDAYAFREIVRRERKRVPGW